MKVAITSKGKSMDSEIEPRFSRSPFFVIVDTETGGVKAFENPGASAKDAACVDAVQSLTGKGVKTVLTGNVGHNAFVTLQDATIRIYLGATGTVRSAVEDFKKRRLSRAKEPSVGFREGLKKGAAIKKA
ncbi:MAG: NifB/NifX family molybdenum-iron cluster-binding protein [Deltaproteobacteria bacterium]|jgi:predicted Fe-Mo cluster-binding NifX family protein|nr:NifB/NifX family molybdenum-iron cluster-binding protein [Deltaproteobacteria bacterium]